MEALDCLHELHDYNHVPDGQAYIIFNGRKICLEVDEQLHERCTPAAQEARAAMITRDCSRETVFVRFDPRKYKGERLGKKLDSNFSDSSVHGGHFYVQLF